MSEIVIRSPLMFGGISQQEAHIRLPNQVADAENAVFSVFDGMRKRPGTQHVTEATPLTADENYRLHTIHRDSDEQYLVIYGNGEIYAYTTDGTEIPVTISTDAASYLADGSPTADQLRFMTIRDYTLIANTTVEIASERSADYDSGQEWESYGSLVNYTPIDGDYHRTKESDEFRPRGYFKYDSGDGTFPHWEFTDVGASWDEVGDNYNDSGDNPGGITVAFQRLELALTGVTVGADGKTITSAGAFASYTPQHNDQLHITGGTNTTAGWYTIASKVDSDTIVLESDCTTDSSSHSDLVTDAIGIEREVTWDFQDDAPTSMYDVGTKITKALRDAGMGDALCSWVPFGTNDGRFQITGPWKGDGTEVYSVGAPATTGVSNWSSTDAPFSPASADKTVGTGAVSSQTLDIRDRWTAVAAPGQTDATLDASTMPVQMVRNTGTYQSRIVADAPIAYYKLGESSGTTAADAMGNYDGTYTNSPTLGATGALDGLSDTAVTFDSSNSERVSLPSMGALGSSLSSGGITVEFWIKTTSDTNNQSVFSLNRNATLSQQVEVFINRTASGDGSVCWFVSDSGGATTLLTASTSNTINDGEWHHVVCTCTPSAGTINIYVDGADVSGTVSGSATSNFDDFSGGTYSIGAGGDGGLGLTGYLDGTVDDVAIYNKVLTSDQVKAHYDIGRSFYSFNVDTVAWNDRVTGDEVSNEVPSIWREGVTVSDIALHRDRLIIAAGENLVFSQAGDLFNFWVDDPENIVDSDPIDVPVSGNPVSVVDFIVPFNKSIAIFTKSGQQFELSAPESLTPDTAAITATTTYSSVSIRPRIMGSRLYFGATQSDNGIVYEYFFEDSRVSNTADNIAAHVNELIPTTIRTVGVYADDNVVMVLPTGGATVYQHRSFWEGLEKKQSAWTKLTIDSDDRIADMGIIEDFAYLLVETGSTYSIEKMPLARERTAAGWPYVVHLDRKHEMTGVHSGGTTTWTLPYADDSLDTIVAGPDFDTAGEVIAMSSNSGGTITATGDYSDGEVIIGRSYDMSVELSRPYRRDRSGAADVDAWIQIRQVVAHYKDSGDLTIKSEMTSRATRTKDAALDITPSSGTLKAWHNGNADDNTISITSDGPRPCTVTAVEFTADYAPRSGR